MEIARGEKSGHCLKMREFLSRLISDDCGGSTVECMLVATVVLILFSTIAYIVNSMIGFIFYRTAVIIVTPYG